MYQIKNKVTVDNPTIFIQKYPYYTGCKYSEVDAISQQIRVLSLCKKYVKRGGLFSQKYIMLST